MKKNDKELMTKLILKNFSKNESTNHMFFEYLLLLLQLQSLIVILHPFKASLPGFLAVLLAEFTLARLDGSIQLLYQK
jgi:hypothetical protein